MGDYKCIFGDEGRQIKWEHITQLYQKERNEGLKVGTKLTNRHMYYFNEKMNVKLAVQVLSNSVSSALTFCQSLGDKYFNDIYSTSKFSLMINNAFDILNCRSKYSKSPFNVSMR